MTSDQLWQAALAQLQMQMTQATFDHWLAGTHLVDFSNGRLLVAVQSSFAKEWLESRLSATIRRVLSDLLKQPFELEFIVGNPPPPPEEPGEASALSFLPEESLAQSLARADYYAAHFQAGGSGYAMLSHYDNTFWMPFLESQVPGSWALYLRLAGQKRATPKNIADRWTDPDRYTYRELAHWLNLSHPRTVSGYIWECYRSRLAIRETGQDLAGCCGQHQPAAVRQDRDQRLRCIYWKTGMLEILYNQHLAAIEEIKASDNKIRSHLLKIQVWRLLPVLTPSQAACLNPELQKAHLQWLADFGHLLGLARLSDWEQIQEPSLVPLMTGYQEYRQLNGPYQPNSRFLEQLRRARHNWKHFFSSGSSIVTRASQLREDEPT